jgi:N-acetylneuraminate synthase
MTFIIAEVGINHNGSIDIAKKLIDEAKRCGADAVKFQKRTVDIVYAGQLDQPRESPWGKTLGDQKRGLELSEADYDEIARYCEVEEIPWFASAWDIPSLKFLKKYNCPYNKIASAMATELHFVDAVAQEQKPTFMSTAMMTGEDIERARARFDFFHNDQLTLMHCVATYPTDEPDLNLACIRTLRNTFGLPVGYSGHEASMSPSVIAACSGAVAIERHITLDRAMYGSDQAASLEPVGFKMMVDIIRKIPVVMGDGVKRFSDAERKVATKLRYWEHDQGTGKDSDKDDAKERIELERRVTDSAK